MDINWTSVNGTLTCTIGDILPIVFYIPLVWKQKLGFIKEGKNYICYGPKANFGDGTASVIWC